MIVSKAKSEANIGARDGCRLCNPGLKMHVQYLPKSLSELTVWHGEWGDAREDQALSASVEATRLASAFHPTGSWECSGSRSVTQATYTGSFSLRTSDVANDRAVGRSAAS